ncbi:MAG TPA: 16S rRNA (guanine(966)-N(2))-methyltransferase RsmD [Anaerolineaceae bacterium]|nr:16S rRNA (guanine(966)-N(2))-methyltransferase RsmD [Anaerolineaceae bacterium]
MSNPRIIAGKARGMRIKPVPGDITRPITDRVKEALFNILGADIQGAQVLDLFGGTGSVGIEALSRGAGYVRFIDLNRPAVTTIQANLKYTRLEENANVIQSDAFIYLKQKPDRQFDYVYIAPPQYKNLWQKALELLDQYPGWLAPDAWIITQIDPVEYEHILFKNFEEFDTRTYGSTILVFYDKSAVNKDS